MCINSNVNSFGKIDFNMRCRRHCIDLFGEKKSFCWFLGFKMVQNLQDYHAVRGKKRAQSIHQINKSFKSWF